MNIILLGMPGSGKGTQARLLAKKLKHYYFEAGDFSRDLAEMNTRIKRIMDKGELIPEEDMTRYVSNYLEDKVDDFGSIVFDGYPRFITQYQFLDGWLREKNFGIDKVIVLNVNENEIVKRLSARRVCTKCERVYNLVTNPPPQGKCKCGGELVQREDDKPEAIKERFDWYKNNTLLMIEYVKKAYPGKIVEIDGVRPIDVIHKDILERIGASNAKN